MCCNAGNADGLGDTRRKELYESCHHVFNISKQHIQVVDHPALQDGMQNEWDVAQVSRSVDEFVKKHSITSVSLGDLLCVSLRGEIAISNQRILFCMTSIQRAVY